MPESQMRIRLGPAQRKALQVAVTLVVLGVLAFMVDFHKAAELMRRADKLSLVAMTVLFPLDRLFMAWKWFLLARVRERTISFWTGTRIYLGSTTIGLFLPLGGLGPDMVRVAMLSRNGMASENALASILVERVCGVAGSLLMLAMALVLLLMLLPEQAAGIGGYLSQAARITALGLVILAALAIVAARIGLHRRVGSIIAARPSLQRFSSAIGAYSGHYGLLVVSVLLAWLEQFAPVIAFALAARGFGLPLGFLECAAIVPLASILERLPISFAGLGVREAGIALAAGWFGVSSTEALLAGFFEHTMFIMTMVPISLLYFVGQRK